MYGMDQFENELKELRIVLSDVQKQQFLVEWNEVMNLTAITDYKDVMKKHFFDSLTVVRAYPEILTEAVSVIDIGTGAGFPGIPLKIAFPQIRLTLLDSLQKRLKFLQEVSDKLELDPDASWQSRGLCKTARVQRAFRFMCFKSSSKFINAF